MEGCIMELSKLSTSFPSLIDRFFESDLMDWANSNYSSTNTSLPRVNIKETNDEFIFKVAAPGMKKDDFRINYDFGKLSISSNVEEKASENKNWILQNLIVNGILVNKKERRTEI